MRAFPPTQPVLALAVCTDPIHIPVNGPVFRRLVIHPVTAGIVPVELCYFPGAPGQLADQVPVLPVEIQMVVPVSFAGPEEPVVRKEAQQVGNFQVRLVGFFQQQCAACGRRVYTV